MIDQTHCMVNQILDIKKNLLKFVLQLIVFSHILSHIFILDLEAARIRNNFTDQKVNVSATITFHCDTVGTPNPKVVWTKNNHTVEIGSGRTGTALLPDTPLLSFTILGVY